MTTQASTRLPILLPPIKQESDSHCGPATLQLLYSYLNRSFTQEEIVAAAGITDRIIEHGTRPAELARAVSTLTPDLQFWFKPQASRQDLHQLICQHRWPAGINWQGMYYETPAEELTAEPGKILGDNGHYSVIIDLELDRDEVVIADPYYEFSDKPRTFSLTWFEGRWWDRVTDIHPVSAEAETIATQHLIFIVAPHSVTFPTELGFMLPSQLDMLKQ